FSDDSRLLASGAMNGEVKLWDLQAPQSVHVFHASSSINSVLFTADGARLVMYGRSIDVVDADTGSALHDLVISGDTVRSTVLGPADSQITFSDDDGSICTWDTSSAQANLAFFAHSSLPLLACTSGRHLVSADRGLIVHWDWKEGRELRRFAGPGT